MEMPSCGISNLAKVAVVSALPGKESLSMEKAKYVTPMLVALMACLGASLYTALHRGSQYYHILWGSGAAASMTGMGFASRFASVKGLDSQVKTFASENKTLEDQNRKLQAQVADFTTNNALLQRVSDGLNKDVVNLDAIVEDVKNTSKKLNTSSQKVSDTAQLLIDLLDTVKTAENVAEARQLVEAIREENNKQQANNMQQAKMLKEQKKMLKEKAELDASLKTSAEVIGAASPQLQKLAAGVDLLSKSRGSSSSAARTLTYE